MTAGQLIYKITPRSDWEKAQSAGEFTGAPIDLQDGYIHFSSADQVADTAAKHFAGQADLLLVAVNADVLGNALRWEVSRGGALFPHLFASLSMDSVAWVKPMPLSAQGNHILPLDNQ